MEDKKPRVKFCWACGRKLYGKHFAERKIPCAPETVVMHKQCAKEHDKEAANPFY